MVKNRFVLIDAFALIYRAYYALPPSMTTDGHPVHAAYGFASALLSAIRILQPEYLAVGMDKGKSHRIKSFEQYKIHRKPTPEDLISQLPYVVDVLKTMNIPYFAVPGYEGEDIIATIIAENKTASHPEPSGEGSLGLSENSHSREIPRSARNDNEMEYIIVTGDLDLLQLVDEQTKVYSMARGVNQAVLYDIAKVQERYGLSPQQFVDFKALKGDASDNIPGVKGVGEKTASNLIREFESLDNLYQEISKSEFLISNKMSKSLPPGQNDKMTKKIQNNKKISERNIRLLLENQDTAFLSQKLSKITADAPLDFTLADAKVHQYDKEKTIALFKTLGFKSLIDRLPGEEKQEPQPRLF